jgi:mono/diheme cytochrome c family protein
MLLSSFLFASILLSAPTAFAAPAAGAKVVITPEARAAAADIFESRCVACHGAEGRGDGPAASNLNPKPLNFHNPRWQKSINDATIARAIVFGGQTVGVSAEMAPNPDLEDEPAVVAALVERVRQLGK